MVMRGTYEFAGIELDMSKLLVRREKEFAYSIDPAEAKMLRVLLAARGRVVSSEDLAVAAFPHGAKDNTVAVYVGRLRKIVGRAAIVKVRESGYYVNEEVA